MKTKLIAFCLLAGLSLSPLLRAAAQTMPKDGDPFHSDLNRFKLSGITGEFFSIYVSATYADPANYAKAGSSARRALDLIDVTYRALEKYPDQLTPCTTAADIRRAKKTGKLCVLMGIEG